MENSTFETKPTTSRPSWMYALFALVLIACIAAGIAIANTIGTKNTSSNAELEQQVTQLQQQVSTLQNQLNNTQNPSPEPTTPTTLSTSSTPFAPSLPPLTTPTSTNAQQPVIPVATQTFKYGGLFIDFPANWNMQQVNTTVISNGPTQKQYKLFNERGATIGALACPATSIDPPMNIEESEARSIINGNVSYSVRKFLFKPTYSTNEQWMSYITVRPKEDQPNNPQEISCAIGFQTPQKPTGVILTQINAIYNSIR